MVEKDYKELFASARQQNEDAQKDVYVNKVKFETAKLLLEDAAGYIKELLKSGVDQDTSYDLSQCPDEHRFCCNHCDAEPVCVNDHEYSEASVDRYISMIEHEEGCTFHDAQKFIDELKLFQKFTNELLNF